MKAIILKPVVWNSNNYIEPSGHVATSGFAKNYGYGHEEWNNSPNNTWRKQKIFHTEATEKLYEYSQHGDLGIILIASYRNVQYALGLATNVSNNSKEEMKLISNELNIYQRKEELWKIQTVKKCFNNNKIKFENHWKNNFQWILWRCPLDHYTWFANPIRLNPKRITGKSKLTTMHGRFQGITPQIALEIVSNHILPEHQSCLWLASGEFDEEIFKKLPSTKKLSGQKLRKKYNIKSGNAPSNNSFEYWVKGKRTVNPHHATLQAKFIKFLKGKGVNPIENKEYIDVQYPRNNKKYMAEIKPTKTVETKYAIRAAVGQLLEYRFTSKKNAILEIVLGSKPKKEEIKFVKSIGMTITYYDKKTKTFISQ